MDLLQTLQEIVGAANVLTGEDVRRRSVGWMDHSPCQALAIVRPETTAEVSQVLAACHAAGQPVVPMGGLTGLVRGCVAVPHEIGLSLERMRKIESVDPVNRTMTLDAGVPLETVQQEADRHGLLYPVDFGARGSAHIGGSVATNAGGNSVIRYGMTRESVLGLEGHCSVDRVHRLDPVHPLERQADFPGAGDAAAHESREPAHRHDRLAGRIARCEHPGDLLGARRSHDCERLARAVVGPADGPGAHVRSGQQAVGTHDVRQLLDVHSIPRADATRFSRRFVPGPR